MSAKLSWTGLKMEGETPDERRHSLNHSFLEHHQNACELIHSKDGAPLAAVYFTPDGRHREETIKLFRMIRERVQFRDEFGEDE